MSSKRITQETDVESLDESLKGGRRFQRYFSCEQCPNDDISRSYQILIQEDGSNIPNQDPISIKMQWQECRTLRNAEKIISDSSIVGSVSWRNNNFRDYSHRVQQLGTVCVHVSAVIPMESNDVLASIQVQDGFVVNVNFIGNSYHEQETVYEVHCHKSDSDCSADCSKVSLSQHLEDINLT